VARSRVELFEQIRKDRRVEGSSIRELADRHHVHRRTVRQALDSAVPAPRKSYPQRAIYGLREPFPARRRRSRASLSHSEVMGCPTAC
jgi:hypothetical protein